MMVVRLCKTSLVGAIAAFFTLVVVNNLTDYDTNWRFVQHVLSMDTTFAGSSLRWRAITDPQLQAAIYWLIIATQIVTAVMLWLGMIRLAVAIRSGAFNRSKAVAASGLTLGLLLYILGFVVIGGEWFAMWQSPTWNGQQKAISFVAMCGMVLIVLLSPDDD
jgi:predicted small integral membrane protein